MKKAFVVTAIVGFGLTAFIAGAAVSFEGQDEKKAGPPMSPPPRPPQLKALDAFVGDWRGEYEHLRAMFGQGAGQAATGTGQGKTEWVLDGRFVKGEGTGTSSYGTHKAIWLMTYDPMMGTYRSFTFDNFGGCDVATMTYDAKARTWTAFSDGFDYTRGKPARNKYTMRFIGNDKMEWHWYVKGQDEADFELIMKGIDTRVRATP